MIVGRTRQRGVPEMQTSSTRLLADYIVASRGHELPPHVIEKAKLWMLDAIGCGLGGSRTVSAHTAVDALTQWSRGPCRVIGRGVSTDPGTSAYLNAQAINALDFDDCDPSGHPSSTLIGALLSLSAICNATDQAGASERLCSACPKTPAKPIFVDSISLGSARNSEYRLPNCGFGGGFQVKFRP